MKQKADSQEKQNANDIGQQSPRDRSGGPRRLSQQPADARADVPAGFQSMPLAACLECAATYDPEVNYANVLASLLQLLAAREEERAGNRSLPAL